MPMRYFLVISFFSLIVAFALWFIFKRVRHPNADRFVAILTKYFGGDLLLFAVTILLIVVTVSYYFFGG